MFKAIAEPIISARAVAITAKIAENKTGLDIYGLRYAVAASAKHMPETIPS